VVVGPLFSSFKNDVEGVKHVDPVTPIIDFGAAFQSTVDGILASLNGILPVALPVVGLMIAIGLGMKLFKRLTARG
jgi:hypothetical protein